ncbi:lysophosphatidylcholine acyltransferase 2 isoform X2 [Onthophagus taurus]|uniref:lysophosphatidylcholine acyltransferase 2 isoform X2 n=1 Tax=Onthophagus taurus TaxID=166361 RepID=UPI0039BE11C2
MNENYRPPWQKSSTNSTENDYQRDDMPNPFVHHLELETTGEKIKTAFLTIVLLPIRVAVICFFLVLGWMIACVALWGISEEELQKKPITGWRRKTTQILCWLGRATFQAGGMQIAIKGKQASRQEAPILVIAPHSTFLDGGIVYFTGFPSLIVRRESGNNPYIGKLINFTQPVYVWRDDPNSRQNSIKEIISRTKSDLDWPQILIFPEGTCTNRSCLITFKPGAFYPGVPVQPVCIRYPNKLDTVTWTWEGPSALTLLWLTLTQVYSSCEIEFLPVYYPNEEEKRDPKLYANNVRAVMAKALGIPVLDYTYDDCKLITRAKEMNLPNANCLLEVQKIRHKLGLDENSTEIKLVDSKMHCKDCSKVTVSEFAHYLDISSNDPALQQLFKIYDKNSTGVIDFREYLLGVLGLPYSKSPMDAISIAFKIYDRSGLGRLHIEDFSKVLSHTLAMDFADSLEIFRRIDVHGLEYVTFDDFKSFMSHNKLDYAYLFNFEKEEEKVKVRNGEICPNDYKKTQ